LDIEDGAGLGLGVDLEHDQAQRDLHRRRVGDAALAALDRVVLGILELVVDEVELGGAGEVADREHRAQRLLEARDVAGALVRAQELFVALALHLDQVRHLHHFVDVAEDLADALLLAADGHAGGCGLLGHGRTCLFARCAGDIVAPAIKSRRARSRLRRDAENAAGTPRPFRDRSCSIGTYRADDPPLPSLEGPRTWARLARSGRARGAYRIGPGRSQTAGRQERAIASAFRNSINDISFFDIID